MNGDKHNGSESGKDNGSDSGKADPAWTPAQLRAACHSGAYRGHTSGLADRHVQGNMVILPDVNPTPPKRCGAPPKGAPPAARQSRFRGGHLNAL